MVFALGFTFSNLAIAKSMAATEYRFLESSIAVNFNTVKKHCDTVLSVAFDKCIANVESIRNASKLNLMPNVKSLLVLSGKSIENFIVLVNYSLVF